MNDDDNLRHEILGRVTRIHQILGHFLHLTKSADERLFGSTRFNNFSWLRLLDRHSAFRQKSELFAMFLNARWQRKSEEFPKVEGIDFSDNRSVRNRSRIGGFCRCGRAIIGGFFRGRRSRRALFSDGRLLMRNADVKVAPLELNEAALALTGLQLEDRVLTLCGGIVRRIPRLPRFSIRLASTAAALAASWTASTFAQQPGLRLPPPTTAVGIQTATKTADPAKSGLSATAPNPDPFLAQLDLAIDVSSRRYLTAGVHSPWQIFHGLLALKQEFQINQGATRVNAIQWIATSEPKFDNQPLLLKTPHGGKFHPFTRPYAFEGHPAQFLALLSQSDLPVDYAFKVGNGQITVSDIINNTMKEVNTREEVTWVLWGLQHYLKPDMQWVNQHNEPWSIERLVQIESAAQVNGAPCGGNHRLFALTRTRDKHLKAGGKLTGVWAQADHKIRQHIEIARSLQNYDGSFSSKFYETSGHTTDLISRFNTSGHTMEFLSIALPNERLNEPWVRNAVTSLCNDLVTNRQRAIDCGPLYHTLNSLIIYRDRVRSMQVAQIAPPTAVVSVPAVPETPPTTPSLVPNAVPVVPTPAATKPVEAKPVTTEKSLPAGESKPNGADESKPKAAETPMPPDKSEPSAEALNELRLEGEFRERLNALTAKKPAPAAFPTDADAKPLETTGQPHLEVGDDEPVSALTPENG